MPRAVIVSASDAKYFDLLAGMLESVEAFARADHIDLAVLDLGLSKSQRTNLANRAIHVKNPGWDYDLTRLTEPPQPFFMAMTARPHLPAHFPGYDRYGWLDADVWVQDWSAIRDYMAVAEANGVAATAECDRSYTPFYSEQPLPRGATNVSGLAFPNQRPASSASFRFDSEATPFGPPSPRHNRVEGSGG